MRPEDLQVAANGLQVGHGRDALAGHFLLRPDATELQQVRRVDGASTHDHLAARFDFGCGGHRMDFPAHVVLFQTCRGSKIPECCGPSGPRV